MPPSRGRVKRSDGQKWIFRHFYYTEKIPFRVSGQTTYYGIPLKVSIKVSISNCSKIHVCF